MTPARPLLRALACATAGWALFALQACPDAWAQETTAALSAEDDHARLLGLLGIDALRPGRSGQPDGPNPANYDEATSNPYPDLPDPLAMDDGRLVTSAALWPARRAELIEHFDRAIYGRAPAETPAVTWEVVAESEDMVGGAPVVTRDLRGRVDNAAYPAVSVDIEMNVTLPANADGPVPAVIHLAFRWPPGVNVPEPQGPTARERIVGRGWAYAELFPSSIQPDNGAGLAEGIIGLTNQGQPRDLDDWGALRAWAWGVSRAIDHFETVPEMDASRVALEGMSRYGKATLVAMAYEPRLAVGFAGSSGEGGASLMRRDNGETVENLAGSGAYHWMAGNFLKYAGPLGWDDLPVDAHSLIALSAPRPLFIGSGLAEEGDAWVDPRGMFIAASAASPVWELLGVDGLSTDEMPAPGVALTDGALAWRQHLGGHTNEPNWETFLEFAEREFGEDER
jgi:hypothetical protein